MLEYTRGGSGPASVDDAQYRLFSPDVGFVAEVEQRDVSALLFYNRHNKVARVLTGEPR